MVGGQERDVEFVSGVCDEKAGLRLVLLIGRDRVGCPERARHRPGSGLGGARMRRIVAENEFQ